MEGEQGMAPRSTSMARNFFARFARPRPRRATVFDGQELKKAVMAGHAWLERQRDAINALNVFPVPDGDTGTNMSLTMRAATKEISGSDEVAACVIAEKLSRGALMGARGNSGVILSQILRGLSNGLDDKATLTAQDFAAALQSAAKAAYQAVITPIEGTILTVVREAADAARQSAAQGADMTTLFEDTVNAAKVAVARTPDLLPKLKEAGVVDAGGQGLTALLEGMSRYLRGESVELVAQGVSAGGQPTEFRKGKVEIEEEFGYEVVFMLHGQNLDLDAIRNTITAMGGVSTVVAGDRSLLKVHTHTPTPGKILDYGVSLGSLLDINIENLQDQSLRYAADSAHQRGLAAPAANGARPGGAFAAGQAVVAAPTPPNAAQAERAIGVVAVAAGDGWTEVYQSVGATIVPGGQTMNPSTEELLKAVESLPNDQVILLPNNKNVIMSAQQVGSLTKKQVYVVPSESPAQGVAALLAYNFEGDFAANCAAMSEAIRGVDTVEITRAVRTTQVDGVNVTEGDLIGLVNEKLVVAGGDATQVARDALGRLAMDRHEIVTVYYGADVAEDTAQALAEQIRAWYPNQEVEVVNGGQPFYDYVISAE